MLFWHAYHIKPALSGTLGDGPGVGWCSAMSLPNEAIEEAAGGEAAEAKEEASKACGFEVRGRMLIWVSKK